jgi:hypothetical protein
LNAKEYRLRQKALLKESMQSALRSWHALDASLTRHRAVKPRADFAVVRFLEAQPEFTKLWFDLLEWVGIMGGLWYLHGKTNSTIVPIVFYASLVLFALYVPRAVGRYFQFFRFPFVKSSVLTMVFHACVSIAAGCGTLYLLKSLVYEIAKHPPG